jgi:LemA protein
MGIFIGIITGAVILPVIIWIISGYNGLVNSRIKVETQYSQIDVQLKMRADLIPNIVETVSAYAGHEKELINSVTQSREKLMGAASPDEEIAAENQLKSSLRSLFAIAESYPDLKANVNFMELQKQLETIEKRIADFRQFYNDTAMLYNRRLEMFPSSIIARMFGFKPKSFYTVTEQDRQQVKIKF